MDRVLIHIGSEYVKVDKGRIRTANQRLKKILTTITQAMKEVSPFFKAMFESCLFSGSSFDGLKIGKPDEYDIDLKLRLPKILDAQVIQSDKDGFVYIWLKNWDKLKKNKKLYTKYRELENFKDDNNYLLQSDIKQWMESVVSRAINIVQQAGTLRNISYETHGPAVTLVANDMTIDLVPVLRFPGEKWPGEPVRPNFSDKYLDYLVVPKPPKIVDDMEPLENDPEMYWRLSFPQQELDFMNNLYNCKPVLRLIKKLRDTQTHNIPSYFIKTIFLWEISERNEDFWKNSLSTIFLEMLRAYISYLEIPEILYFWSEEHNFLEVYNESNITNIREFLEGILDEIEETRETNPLMVARYLLKPDEFRRTCRHFGVDIF